MTGDKTSALAICERVAEVQAILHDHKESDRFTADEVVHKLSALMAEGYCYAIHSAEPQKTSKADTGTKLKAGMKEDPGQQSTGRQSATRALLRFAGGLLQQNRPNATSFVGTSPDSAIGTVGLFRTAISRNLGKVPYPYFHCGVLLPGNSFFAGI